MCCGSCRLGRVRDVADEKLKKGSASTVLNLVENPDILATLARPSNHRPRLVIGFAAETYDVLINAGEKFAR